MISNVTFSFRFGKPFIIDMMDVNMLEQLKNFFNAVQPELWENVISKKILQEEW